MGNFTVNGEVANREQAYQELTDLVAGRRYNLGELVLKDGRLEIINNHAVTFLGIHRNDTRTNSDENELVRKAVYNLLKAKYENDATKNALFEEISVRLIGKGYSYLPLTRREACGYLQMLAGEYTDYKLRIDRARNTKEDIRVVSFEVVDELFRNEHGIDGRTRVITGLSSTGLKDYSRSQNIQLEDWRKVAAEAVFSETIEANEEPKRKRQRKELEKRIGQAERLDPAELAGRVEELRRKGRELKSRFSLLKGDWNPDNEQMRRNERREQRIVRLKGNQDTYRHDVQLHKDVKTVLESLKGMLAENYPKGATVLLGANPTQVKLGGKTYNLVRPRPLKEGEKEQKLAKNEILLDPDDERAFFTVNADGRERTVIRANRIAISEEQVRTWLGNREGLDAVEVLGEVNGQLRRGGLEIEEIIRDCEEQAANCQNELQRTTEALMTAEAGGDGQQELMPVIEEVNTKKATVQKKLEEVSGKILGVWRKSVDNPQQGNVPGVPVADEDQGGAVDREADRENGDGGRPVSPEEAKVKMEELERELDELNAKVDQAASDAESVKKLPEWKKELSDLKRGVPEGLRQKLADQTFKLLVEREEILSKSPAHHENRMVQVAALMNMKEWGVSVHDFKSFKSAVLNKILERKNTRGLASLARGITLECKAGTVSLTREDVETALLKTLEKRIGKMLEEAEADVLKGLDQWFAEGKEVDGLEDYIERMAVAVGKRIEDAMAPLREDGGAERTYFLRDAMKTISTYLEKRGALRNEANRNRLEQLFHADADAVDPEVKTGAGGPPGGDFFNMIKSGGKYKEQELAAYISSFNARGLKSNGSDVRIDEAMVRGLDESFIRNAQKELAQIRMTAEMIGIDWEWLEPHMDFGIGVFVSYATMLQTALRDVAGKIDETLKKGIPADEAGLADYRKALLDAHKLLSARKAMFGRMKRVRGLIDQANSVNPAEDGQEQTELEKAVEGFSRANVNSPMQGEGAGFFAKLFATKAEKAEQKNTEFYNKGFVDSVGRQLAGNMANRLVRFAKVQFEALNTGINGLYADVNPENKVELADEVNSEDGVVQKNQAVTEDSRWKALNAAINRFNASLGEKERGKLQIKTEDLQTPETWRRAEKWQRYQQDVPSFVQQQFYMGMDGDVVDFPGLEEELAEFDNSRKVNSKDVDSYKLKPLYYVIDPEKQAKEEPNGI